MNKTKWMASAILSLGLAFAGVTGAQADTGAPDTSSCSASDVPTAETLHAYTDSELADLGLTRATEMDGDLVPVSWLVSTDTAVCDAGVYALGSQYHLSSIWSGYLVSYPSDRFVGVEGKLHVPSVSISSTCSPQTYAGWVGIGGFNSYSLIQAGILTLPGKTTPTFFYEWLGPNGTGVGAHTLPNLSVAPGDDVLIKVTYQTSTQLATFLLTNVSRPGNSLLYPLHLDTSFYDGTHAEWVDERLSYRIANTNLTAPYALSDFGVASWTNAKVMLNSTGQYVDMTSEYQTPLAMHSDAGNYLAFSPNGAYNSTSFYDHFYNCE